MVSATIKGVFFMTFDSNDYKENRLLAKAMFLFGASMAEQTG